MLFLCFAVVSLRSGGLTVTSKIMATGLIKSWNGVRSHGFIVQAEIDKQSSDSYVVVCPSCGWSDAWTIPQEDDFYILPWSCESNRLTKTVLNRGAKILFTFTVLAKRKDAWIKGNKVKFGFIWQRWSPKGWPFGRPDSDAPIIWSNELVVPELSDQLLDGRVEGPIVITEHPSPN